MADPDAIMCSVIAHLDLDAFYAACEQLDDPKLRGVPLVVGGDPHGRGVVATASYEARAFGIRSAMSCAEALRRCPKAVFVRPDFERYRRRSRAVWSLVGSLVERIEQVGIDEGYLDLSACDGDAATAEAALQTVQRAVLSETGLSCSLGCGTSKTVAKIASDRRKPGGLVVIPPGGERAFLGPLALRLLPGIGPRSEARLRSAGLRDDRRPAGALRRAAGAAPARQGRRGAARPRARGRRPAGRHRARGARLDRGRGHVRPGPDRPRPARRGARADRPAGLGAGSTATSFWPEP